ncbi:uncharacterized protein LOC131687063 [Topomyia yanbarensis]|uniref:uncharacterized protein LOC131687063 n=1 Tax=Topomyia yanbarensis TaxID=2498891 RepID=UPI00273CC7E6|nr:uncharacterized protein LOC131687063 [Topomyia yanbarensis]
MEPFRKGTSFTHWVERLEFLFIANKIPEVDRKAHFITLVGPHVYYEIKLLFRTGSLTDVPLATIVDKLKVRLDNTASGVCQRISFNQRIQNADESAEDFLLALKLQAELCAYGGFKKTAILDRLLAGLRDVMLKQRILSEPVQSLKAAENVIQTWEAAKSHVQGLASNNFSSDLIASVSNGGSMSKALSKIAAELPNDVVITKDKSAVKVAGPLDNLMVGDEVWYKNHNPHNLPGHGNK